MKSFRNLMGLLVSSIGMYLCVEWYDWKLYLIIVTMILAYMLSKNT